MTRCTLSLHAFGRLLPTTSFPSSHPCSEGGSGSTQLEAQHALEHEDLHGMWGSPAAGITKGIQASVHPHRCTHKPLNSIGVTQDLAGNWDLWMSNDHSCAIELAPIRALPKRGPFTLASLLWVFGAYAHLARDPGIGASKKGLRCQRQTLQGPSL